jgi:hypothetical protein
MHQPIEHSALKDLSLLHEVYISDIVLDELVTTVREHHGVFANPDTIFGFKQFFGLHIIASSTLQKRFLTYVYDVDDAQILQDAVSIQADILLTNNLKDFRKDIIQKDFGMQVVDMI